jgi:hypothetical protein
VWINKPATPADTATTALPASARIDALEAGRDNSTPETGVSSLAEEETMLVEVH